MKRLLSVVACLSFALALFAESERISMIVGSTKTVTVPFVVESYRVIPGNNDKVHVEATESQLRIVANAVCDFDIIATGNGLKKEYSVSVKSNLSRVLKQLRTDLDALTELEIGINEDKIVIRGTVTQPDHWNFLQKVLPNYAGNCVNFAVFRPSSATMMNLKKMLEDAGFAFAEDDHAPKTGELSMKIAPDAITLNGELYSEGEIKKIHQILETQTWLTTAGATDEAKGLIRAFVNLTLVETLLQVDVVYVGISDDDLDRIGSPNAPTLSVGINYLYELFHGGQTQAKSATFGGNMDSTVSFLAKNGLSRTYSAGHVSFLNNDPQGGELHTGGTIYTKVSGIENGSLQNIDYGLTITVKGGLVSPTTAKLDLNLVNSYLLGASEDSYNLKKDATRQTVFCDLDKTIAIAGSERIAQETQQSGLPILRNTPVLNWFVSEHGDMKQASRLLVLVCPRLVKSDAAPQIEIPLDQETASTYPSAQKDTKQELEDRNRTHTGFWSWLNWFNW